jgi:hypothetical protein
MKDFSPKQPINIEVLSLDGTLVLNKRITDWINPSYISMWLKEQLNECGSMHVFINQDEKKYDFVMNY